MIHESYLQIGNDYYFLLHSELQSARPTLLFIHGLGDSALSYRAYLHSALSQHYNILIPDLLGYGKSSASSDYSFARQVQGIEQQIEHFPVLANSDFILVAHSMGGIHATLLCESKLKQSIKGFINVEGSITQFGSFIAADMMHALKDGSFDSWYKHFKQKVVYEKLAQEFVSIRPYYAALEFCQSDAFLQNAKQMYQLANALPGQYKSSIGKQYAELAIPRIYCYGDTMSKDTLGFLREHQLESRYFPCKNHFLLSECIAEFVVFIGDYVNSLLLSRFQET